MICDSVRIYWPAISMATRQALVFALQMGRDGMHNNRPWVFFKHPRWPAAYMYYLAQHEGLVPNNYTFNLGGKASLLEAACYSTPDNEQAFANTAAGALFKTNNAARQTFFAMHPSEPGANFHHSEQGDLVVAVGLFRNLQTVATELRDCRLAAKKAGTPLIVVQPQYEAMVSDTANEDRLRGGLFLRRPFDRFRGQLADILRAEFSIERVPSGHEMQMGLDAVSEDALREVSASGECGWLYKHNVVKCFFESTLNGHAWHKYWLYVNACQAFVDQRYPLSESEHVRLAQIVADVVDSYEYPLQAGDVHYAFHLFTAE